MYNAEYANPIAIWAFNIFKFFVGRPIVVHFQKRTDGQMRRMVCIYSHKTVEKLRYDIYKRNLLQVWDCELGEPRFVSMDAVSKIVAGGLTFTLPVPAKPHPPVIDAKKMEKAMQDREWVNSLIASI